MQSFFLKKEGKQERNKAKIILGTFTNPLKYLQNLFALVSFTKGDSS